MFINLLMVLAMVAAVISLWKWDTAIAMCHRWDCKDAARYAEAYRRARRWRAVSAVAVVAYLLAWFFGGSY